MDLNNMKVTDLKKELKSRGLSIVGNKSELITRLNEAMAPANGSLDANNAEHNEDSALEDQLLGDESVADVSISKTDDHLIDDLLNTNDTKVVTNVTKEESTAAVSGNKSPTKATIVVTTKTSTTVPSSVTNETSKANDSAVSGVKATTTAVKVLSAEERKQLRAQKFGDNKLAERANRFGLKGETQSTNTSTNIDEKLQKRAQRFGAIVSDKLKQIDDSQKLQKRKERFGVNTVSNVKTTTTTDTKIETTGATKRKITFSSNEGNEQKQKRLERFGKFL